MSIILWLSRHDDYNLWTIFVILVGMKLNKNIKLVLEQLNKNVLYTCYI